MLLLQDENQQGKALSSLPDLSVLASPEVELPTLSLDLDPLEDTTDYTAPVASIHLDPLQVGHYRVSPLAPVLDLLDSMNSFHGYPGPEASYTGHNMMAQMEQKRFVRIIEEPKSNSLRFRYQCEGRGAGALQGASSTPELRTFPKIKIEGYQGPAVVVVSCVSHDGEKPKAHPHNLVSPAAVGREGCKKGVCTMNVPWQPGHQEDMTVEFQHLGIQCVRRRDIGEALKIRQEIRVDPHRQGFEHANSPQSIDLNAVRLCFQVFLENPASSGKYTVPLPPVSSKPIFDAKAKKTLQIMDISETSAPAEGGKKIIILCERVARDDIKVRFFDPMTSWEAWGDFTAQDVHKQYAITFKTPPYIPKEGKCSEKKVVMVELIKPSDESTSEPRDFTFLPIGHQIIESPRQEQKPVQQSFNGNVVGNIWNVKKEKEETSNGWGFPPASSPYIEDRSYYHQESPPTTHPYIPVVPNPYPYTPQQPTIGSPHTVHPPQQATIGSPHTVHSPQHQAIASPHTVPGAQAHMQNIKSPPVGPQMGGQVNYQGSTNTIYGVPQASPDSQQFSEMNLRSPDIAVEDEVDQLSGKIESFSLAPSLSDCVSLSLDMQQQNIFPNAPEGRKQKRGAATAELESGSLTVPRGQARVNNTGFIDTPEVSGQLNTPNTSNQISGVYQLNNCSRVNDL